MIDTYEVYRVGGSVGESREKIVATRLSREKAVGMASRMRRTLTKGEKTYYKMSYRIRKEYK